ETFGNCEPDGLKRREVGVKLADLEGSRQATQHPDMHGQFRDVVAFEQNPSRIRLQHAGQKIDHRGLARAVRADQGVTGALLDLQRKVARDLQAAKLLCQSSGFQGERHDASVSGTATTALPPPNRRIIRFGTNNAQRCSRARPTSTITTSTSPIQNCQYCGVMVEKNSCNSRNTTAPISPP